MRADDFFLLINEIDDALVIEAPGEHSSPERAEFKKSFPIKGIIAAAACFAALAAGIFMIARVRMSGTFSPGDSAASAGESSANAVAAISSETYESTSSVVSGVDSSVVSGNDSSTVSHDSSSTVPKPEPFFKQPMPRDIVYDPEHNVSYVKNQLLISAFLDTPKEKIEQLAKELDAEIVGYRPRDHAYQIEFLTDKTLDELEAAADYLNSFSFVENVTLHMSYELPDCEAVSPKPEDIVYDPEHNVSYVKNQLLISASLDTPKDNIKQLVKELGAEIVGYIELTNDYQIEFTTDKTLDELEAAADYLNSFSFVENVTLNLMIETTTAV